jgi:lysophospholipase L1-like esterase
LREFAAPRGIEVIDLSEWVRGVPAKQIAIDTCHFNAEGHRLVGEHLADYLLQHDLRD